MIKFRVQDQYYQGSMLSSVQIDRYCLQIVDLFIQNNIQLEFFRVSYRALKVVFNWIKHF